MDKKEEKIDQEGFKPLEQQVKNSHNSNVWLVFFFVLLSSLTIFSFHYLSKFNSDRINNFFLSNNTKTENEIIDEKFSDYWERLNKIVELIFITLVLIGIYCNLKSSFQSKILKSIDDKNVKKIRDGFSNFQKNIVYDYYEQNGFFDRLKKNTIKKIDNYASAITKKNEEIKKIRTSVVLLEKEEAISRKEKEISTLKEMIIKLSYLLDKIFSKETIFEIIGFFLNSQSITVNPLCEYNILKNSAGESLGEIKNYYKKYFFSKVNGEKVLPIFEENFGHIFFKYYVSEDDNEVLEDVEEVTKRAKKVVTYYENLEANENEGNKILKEIADAEKHKHNQYFDELSDNEVENNKKKKDEEDDKNTEKIKQA